MSGLELSILIPALLAGLLVLSTHVPLGRQVLARGIIFIDLAVAQVAALGLIAAHAAGWGQTGWPAQLAAAGAALLAAALLTWTERRWPDTQEALIGAVFVVSASLAVLLVAHDPHGGEQLKDLLAGQILWVTGGQLAAVAALYALVLLLWRLAGPRLGRTGFYALFALCITASVQLVGVYLVFASLIVPALACRRARRPLLAAYAVGAAGYGVGLAGSALLDLPSGPAIVLALAGVALASVAIPRPRTD